MDMRSCLCVVLLYPPYDVGVGSMFLWIGLVMRLRFVIFK